MQNITHIDIDFGKHSFHIHFQDKSDKVLLRKKFTRTKLIEFLAGCASSAVVMEACAGSQFMARRIVDLGHEAKLISPQLVCPFVKSNKNDFVDSETICEAVLYAIRATTNRSSAGHVGASGGRGSLDRDKVKTTSQMHAFLPEFGISMPAGVAVVKRLSTVLAENELPPCLAQLLMRLHVHYSKRPVITVRLMVDDGHAFFI